MLRKATLVVMVLALLLPFAGCKKKEQPPQQPAAGAPGGMFIPPTEPQVITPENVKGKWDSVVLLIEDKATGKTTEAKVKVGGDYKIPNSGMKVSVVDFLPDFRMEGTTITSSSNELNNPAARVRVYDGSKEIFKGWLYAKFPAIHPFQNDKYGITLKEGISKS